MKIIDFSIFLLLSLFIMTNSTSCLGRSGNGDSENKSTLEFDSKEWDFGKIQEVDGMVAHTFSFTNKGDEAIVLESVSTSCGCATPNYSRKPILPSTKGTITVTFDPTSRPGMFVKSIYVKSRGGQNDDVLTIKGEVIPRPRTVEEDYPANLSKHLRVNLLNVNFKYVGHGSGTAMSVGYVNTSDKEMALDFIVEPESKLIAIDAPKTICAGCRGDIVLICQVLDDDNIYGTQNVKIYPVIDGRKGEVPFNVSAIITDNFENADMSKKPVLDIKPAFYHFGNVAKGATLVKEFILINDGESPLVIRSVEERRGVVTTLKAGVELLPGKKTTFECEYTPLPDSKGVVTGSVIIVSNDPTRPMRELRVAANVK